MKKSERIPLTFLAAVPVRVRCSPALLVTQRARGVGGACDSPWRSGRAAASSRCDSRASRESWRDSSLGWATRGRRPAKRRSHCNTRTALRHLRLRWRRCLDISWSCRVFVSRKKNWKTLERRIERRATASLSRNESWCLNDSESCDSRSKKWARLIRSWTENNVLGMYMNTSNSSRIFVNKKDPYFLTTV